MNDCTLQDTSRQPSASGANVKSHFWDRDDFDDLVGRRPHNSVPVPRYGVANFLYPKSTKQAMLELRLRGLDASMSLLEFLLGRGNCKVAPKSQSEDPLDVVWEKTHIDAVADYLYHANIWLPQTHLCSSCNLRYGQFIRAYLFALIAFGSGQKDWSQFDLSHLLTVVEPAKSRHGYGRILFLSKETELVLEVPAA